MHSTTPVDAGPDGSTRSAEGSGYANAGFDRYNSTIDEYNTLAAGVMARAGVQTIDLHGFTTDALEPRFPRRGTYDAVHFSEPCRAEQAVFIAGRLRELGVVPEIVPVAPSDLRAAYTPPWLAETAALDAASGLGEEVPPKYSVCPTYPLYQVRPLVELLCASRVLTVSVVLWRSGGRRRRSAQRSEAWCASA